MSMAIVIIERTGNAAIIKCGSCRGSGSSRYHQYCRACNGTGHATILCEQPDVPIVKCGSCDGSGSSRYHQYCQACGGVGAVPAFGTFKIMKAERQE
jgi:DnaJ-class molecular chaperone